MNSGLQVNEIESQIGPFGWIKRSWADSFNAFDRLRSVHYPAISPQRTLHQTPKEFLRPLEKRDHNMSGFSISSEKKNSEDEASKTVVNVSPY